MRTHALTLSVLAAFAWLASGCAEPPARAEARWPAMGTYAEVEIYAADERVARRLVEDVRESLTRAERLLSNWSDESALSELHRDARADGVAYVEAYDLYRCVKLALAYARSTRGTFDPTVGTLVRAWGFRPRSPRVPSEEELSEALAHVGWEKLELTDALRAVRFSDRELEIDLGGIGKGYGLDIAARRFASFGAIAGRIDLGGNQYVWGSPPEGDAWRLGIRDPRRPDRVLAVLETRDRAVATSGAYGNRDTIDGVEVSHVLDPRTGRPPDAGVLSATVLSDSGAEADALATAFAVSGVPGAGDVLERSVRIEAILVVESEVGVEVLASESLAGNLALEPGVTEGLAGSIRFILPPESIR